MLMSNPQYINDASVERSFASDGYQSYYARAKQQLISGSLSIPDNRSYVDQVGIGSYTTPSSVKFAQFITGLSGKGDEVSTIAIPPVDTFALQQQLMQMDQTPEQAPTVVNQYLVGHDTSSDDGWIDRLNQITFNVRAERVEELLQDISDKLDSVRSGGTTVVTTPSKPDESAYRIPEGVTKLARG